MTLAACVLAAGASRRMGRPKALLVTEGRSFLDRLCSTFRAAGIDRLYVVGQPEAEELQTACAGCGARFLANPEPERGMLSSLHVCLRELTTTTTRTPIDGLFVAPVDCPHVQAATISQLARGFETSGAPIVVPSFGARRGHPTLFSAALFQELLEAPPDLGARAVVWAHATDRLEVPVDDPAILDDIDTPEGASRLDARVPPREF